MNLFDRLVEQALTRTPNLSSLRMVVEKELLHHDILRVMQNVDTWKVKIETRPESKSMPAQRINIDICALPSYERRPAMLLNPYGVDMGTSGLRARIKINYPIWHR